jgi:hypothetical protein
MLSGDWIGGRRVGAQQLRQIVQRACIEEQGPNYLLDPRLLCERNWGRMGGGG